VGYLSDRASSRKIHYLLGLFALILSTALVALARNYWLLIISRFLQGCSSAIVWTVGMALLADSLPTEQLGVAMGTIGSMVSLALVGSPVIGGSIYHHFGFEAVFIALGAMLLIDVVLRLILIEKKDAQKWGVGVSEEEPRTNDNTPLIENGMDGKPSVSLFQLLLVPYLVDLSHITVSAFSNCLLGCHCAFDNSDRPV
jgi:MFS family permease